MDVLREREVKDTIERQYSDERKLRGKFGFVYWFMYQSISGSSIKWAEWKYIALQASL